MCVPRIAGLIKKASQSFAPAGAKGVKSVFSGGMYVGKHSLRGACGNSRSAASGGCSEAVSRKRHDWRRKQRREAYCRDGDELAACGQSRHGAQRSFFEQVTKLLARGMITLCLLLSGCGGGEETAPLRQSYHDMAGCAMEAEVTCAQAGAEWTAQLRCDYVPGGESTVEVLAPEEIAGVRALLRDTDWSLEYDGLCLNAGALSREELSPAECLPRMMDALRDGWLLEENEETWDGVECLRLCVDQSGQQAEKLLTTLWLRVDNGMPLRGEIAVDGEIILTAEFTAFSFYDTIDDREISPDT